LAQRVGPDSHRLLQETRKLAAYAGDRPSITPQDVTEMVTAPPDDNIFRLLDLTMQGDRRAALDQLRQLRESGTAVPQVMSLLRRSIRQAVQARLLLDRRIPYGAEREAVPEEVLALLPEDNLYRATKEWQRRRIWEQARRLSWPHLHHALDRLAVAEAGMKGWEHGVQDPDLALELFVISLCEARM
ncbi:MAG TPA: hypothetical protein VFU47_12415, partial [Armatimonadota bacterium]|nr:hypothetical protein [Armatimonadota bacterium]